MQISVDYGKYRWGLCQTAIGSARLGSARVGERVDVSSKHILQKVRDAHPLRYTWEMNYCLIGSSDPTSHRHKYLRYSQNIAIISLRKYELISAV